MQAYAYYGGKFDDAFHARENCYNVRLTACACPSISERKMTCVGWLKKLLSRNLGAHHANEFID